MNPTLPCPKFILTLFILPLLILASCSEREATPEEITLDFFQALYNDNDLVKAETFCTEASKPNLRSTIRAIQGALVLTGEEKHNNEYKIVENRSSVNGDTAIMTVSSSLDTTTMQIRLVQIEKQWLVDFNYDAHVMEKGLIDEVLRVVEPMTDSVEVEK